MRSFAAFSAASSAPRRTERATITPGSNPQLDPSVSMPFCITTEALSSDFMFMVLSMLQPAGQQQSGDHSAAVHGVFSEVAVGVAPISAVFAAEPLDEPK